MSFLFGSDSPAPAPQPVPESPIKSEAAQAERDAAASAAQAESRAAGRQQTVVAGAKLAADDQQEKGLLSAKRRTASRALVG